jgi:hypothetical protein
VNLTDGPGTYAVEWFSLYKGTTTLGKPVTGGTVRAFTTPFGGPAVLYLKSSG